MHKKNTMAVHSYFPRSFFLVTSNFVSSFNPLLKEHKNGNSPFSNTTNLSTKGGIVHFYVLYVSRVNPPFTTLDVLLFSGLDQNRILSRLAVELWGRLFAFRSYFGVADFQREFLAVKTSRPSNRVKCHGIFFSTKCLRDCSSADFYTEEMMVEPPKKDEFRRCICHCICCFAL